MAQYQLLDTASMAKYKPTDYARQASGAVVLNQGVAPIAGTFKPLAPQATLAKSPTDRIAVATGTPQAQKLFGQGYQLEQKIPSPAQLPNFTQTNKMGAVLYGINKPLTTADLGGQAGNQLPEAKTQNQNMASESDMTGFNKTLAGIQTGLTAARTGVVEAGQVTPEISGLNTQLADVQKAGTDFALDTQQLQSAQDFNPNLLTSQVGKSQAQIERERSFKSQEYKLDEANLINRLGLAKDAQKTAIDAAKFGYSSLLDDANLAFKVQERVDTLNQQAKANAQSLQGSALQKATLAMNAFKEGLVSGKNSEALKSSLGLLLNQAGIDPAISSSMFDAIQSGVEFSRIKDLTTAGQVSATTKANMVKELVMSGLSLEAATAQANQILGASGGIGTQGAGTTSETTTTGQTFGAVGSGEGGMRTDRHNNPVAMTTDVAKTLGLVEGKDYTKGDAFPNNPNLFTARLTGDGVTTTIKGLDAAASDPKKKAFYTQGGQQRWTHTAMSDDKWLAMAPEQKRAAVGGMYKREGGDGSLFGGATPTPTKPTAIPDLSSKYNEDVLGTAKDVARGTMELANVDSKIKGNVQRALTEMGLTPGGGIPGEEKRLSTTESQKLNKELVNGDAYKAIKKGGDSLQYLQEFEKIFKQVGLESLPTKAKGQLSATHRAALLNLKEFFNLGVLNGPDLEILESILPSAVQSNTILGVPIPFGKLITGQKGKINAGIETLKTMINKTLDDRYDSVIGQYGDYSTKDLTSLAEVQKAYVKQKSAVDPNVAKIVKENPKLSSADIIAIIKQ